MLFMFGNSSLSRSLFPVKVKNVRLRYPLSTERLLQPKNRKISQFLDSSLKNRLTHAGGEIIILRIKCF